MFVQSATRKETRDINKIYKIDQVFNSTQLIEIAELYTICDLQF